MAENEKEKESARRFQEQCILMSRWKELVKFNQNRTGRDDSNIGQSLIGEEDNITQYQNFVAIDHPKPYEFMNALFKKSDKANLLLKMTNEQMSLLVPKLQIFKYYKDPDNKEEMLVEMPFEDHMTRQEVENITKSIAGRGGGAGIKYFEWTSLGKQEEEKYQFGAQLVLHLQGIEELFKTRTIAYLPSGKKVEVKYSDLILHQKKLRKGENEGSSTWDPDYFRLKVAVGWHVPKLPSYTQALGVDLVNAIRETNHSLFMVLKDHEIEFLEDGSIDLKISFIAGEELDIENPQTANILFPSKEYLNERKYLQKEIRLLRKRIRELGYDIGFSGSGSNEIDFDSFEGFYDSVSRRVASEFSSEAEDSLIFSKSGNELDRDQEISPLKRFRALTKRLNELPDTPRGESYPRIVRGLLDSNKVHAMLIKQEFSNKTVEVNRGEGEENTIEEEVQQSLMNAQSYEISPEIVSSPTDFSEEEGATQNERFSKLVKKINDVSQNAITDNGERVVNFFFLGDLLDITLQGMFLDKAETNDNFFNKQVKILLGPVSFIDYGNIEKVGQVTRSPGVKNTKNEGDEIEERWRGEFTSINIADIPISLNVFINWYNKTIVETGAERFSFRKFLSSIITDLVIRAVSHQCYDLAPEQQARISYKTFSVPKDEKRDQFFSLGRVELSDIMQNKLEFKIGGEKSSSEKHMLQKYILVYGIKEPPFDLKSDYVEDYKRGIYHLYYGDERGVVTGIKFSKSDIPYLEESNVVNQLKEGGETTRILRKRYNANVEMFGNAIFDVGQILHINPTVMGSGDSSARLKMLKELGIGGYFQVINHTNRVEAGMFKTELKTEWVAAGDGTTNILDKQRGDIVIRKGKSVNKVTKTSDKAEISEDHEELIKQTRASTMGTRSRF